MSETIFSKIIRKEIPASVVYETEEILAFRDITPQAPTHILIIPKKPIKDISSATESDRDLLGDLLLAAAVIAKQEKVEKGYRIVINTGAEAGQSVFHLHVHLLAGRQLGWPPG